MTNHPTPRSQLRIGGKLPLFYLPSTQGGQSGPSAMRSKYNLVLAFLPGAPQAARYLREVAEIYPQILRNDARLISVLASNLDTTQRTAQALELSFTLLSDENAATASCILGDSNRAALISTDRYGIIYFTEQAPTIDKLPQPDTILDWLEYIEIQCPECTDANSSPWFLDENKEGLPTR